MRLVGRNNNKVKVSSNEIRCEKCEKLINVKDSEVKSESHFVLIFDIKNKYIICPNCKEKIYITSPNHWSANLGIDGI